MPDIRRTLEAVCDTTRESERLAAVRSTGLLDSPPEQVFDDITRLAARLCDAPVSTITLIDDTRQWFKSAYGVPPGESPREGCVCTCTIEEADAFMVPDLTQDTRFAGSWFVTGAPHHRAYAGVPLRGIYGHAHGALCVMDSVPREFTEEHLDVLRSLGRQVEAQIALRQRLWEQVALAQEAKELTRELTFSNQRFCAFMDHSPISAYIKRADGRMSFYNRRLAETFGVTEREWLDKTDQEIWPAEDAAAFRRVDTAVLSEDRAIELEERTPAPGGGHLYWKSYKFPFTDAHGERFLAGISVDVTQQKQYEAELERAKEELTAATIELNRLTVTDALTGLPNRRGFDQFLAMRVREAERSCRPLALMLLDIDHFKRINDTRGHIFGDAVLRDMGRILPTLMRETDHGCRYGGEEFAMLLVDSAPERAWQVAGRVCALVPRLMQCDLRVTVSVGLAQWQPGMCAEDLVAAADTELYKAKSQGRDRVCVSTREAATIPAPAPFRLPAMPLLAQ